MCCEMVYHLSSCFERKLLPQLDSLEVRLRTPVSPGGRFLTGSRTWFSEGLSQLEGHLPSGWGGDEVLSSDF